MEIAELYNLYLQNPSVETDTRKIKRGDIFFALKGPHHNGNEYAQTALDAGASFCIADEALSFQDERIISVHNSLECLQQLAKKHREQFDIPFIAITGSNGKTTTKELVHAALSATYKTYTTTGNFNNHIGVPLTILKIKKDAQFAVIEMGANHQKEIEGYCSIAMPTHGLITNCGKAHLEGFGSMEGIKKGKGELYDYLRNNHGAAFVCWDYAYLREMSNGIQQVIKYGTLQDEVNYAGRIKNTSEYLDVEVQNDSEIMKINTQLVGDYNLPNILAAVAIGRTFSIPLEKIKVALENYVPANSRSQLMEKGSNKIILDAYNANPSSMKAAIENFAIMKATNKVLILGAMMELGNESLHEHQMLAELIRENHWQAVVLVGKDFESFAENFIYFNDVSEAHVWFKKQAFTDTHILIKGSRSMQMEKILE